jgi:hypothetical protein
MTRSDKLKELMEVAVVNVTIALEEQVLERASARAEQQGLSLDALLREYIETFASVPAAREEAVRTLLDLSLKAQSGSGGSRWTRDELHAH